MSLRERFLGPRARRRALILGAIGLGLWVAFLDSHSLVRRAQYYVEHRTLAAENAALQGEIDKLEERVEAGLSDGLVEEIAREQYGMRRPGETVYPVDAD